MRAFVSTVSPNGETIGLDVLRKLNVQAFDGGKPATYASLTSFKKAYCCKEKSMSEFGRYLDL